MFIFIFMSTPDLARASRNASARAPARTSAREYAIWSLSVNALEGARRG